MTNYPKVFSLSESPVDSVDLIRKKTKVFLLRVLDILNEAQKGKFKYTNAELDEMFAYERLLREQLKQSFHCTMGNSMEFYSKLIASGYTPVEDTKLYIKLVEDLNELNEIGASLRHLSLMST